MNDEIIYANGTDKPVFWVSTIKTFTFPFNIEKLLKKCPRWVLKLFGIHRIIGFDPASGEDREVKTYCYKYKDRLWITNFEIK